MIKMRLVTIKFNNSNRGYDYIVPENWKRKIKVGDIVVVPPSSFKSESQEVKVIAIGAEPKPNIKYVELIGFNKNVENGEHRSKAEAAERVITSLIDQYHDYWLKQI